MSATMDNNTDWQAQALQLRGEHEAATIAQLVGKHPATIRKLFARTPEDESIPGQTTVDDHLEPDAPEDDPERHVDPLDQFRAEAGEPVGPMPPGSEEGTEPEVETRIRGTRQMALDFGGEADMPVGGTLVLKSDKLASGFFGLGDLISGTFTARITDVGAKERFDNASEEFRAKPTAHVALITEFTVE